MQFTPYALPAIVALLAKLGMFFYARRSNVHNLQTRLYLLFLFSVSIQNVAEITFFTTRVDGSTIPPGVRLYFAASIVAIGLFLHFAITIGTGSRLPSRDLPPYALVLLYAPTLILESLLWSGPLLVAGFDRMHYTYTKIPGPLYFLFECYAIGYLSAALALFVYGWRK